MISLRKIPTIKIKGNNTIDINDIHATETRLVSITAIQSSEELIDMAA